MNEFIFYLIHLFVQPSRQDIIDFLSRDETNLIPYSETFNCKEFTETLIGNSYFDAFPVGVGFDNGEGVVYHMFVGFNTSDGVVWVEPQNDKFYVVSDEELCYEDGECVADLLFVYLNP